MKHSFFHSYVSVYEAEELLKIKDGNRVTLFPIITGDYPLNAGYLPVRFVAVKRGSEKQYTPLLGEKENNPSNNQYFWEEKKEVESKYFSTREALKENLVIVFNPLTGIVEYNELCKDIEEYILHGSNNGSRRLEKFFGE